MKLLLVLFTEFYFLMVALSAVFGYVKFKSLRLMSLVTTVVSALVIVLVLHLYYIQFEWWQMAVLAVAFLLETLIALAGSQHLKDQHLRTYTTSRLIFHLILLGLLFYFK